jgi:hypothetical protein
MGLLITAESDVEDQAAIETVQNMQVYYIIHL